MRKLTLAFAAALLSVPAFSGVASAAGSDAPTGIWTNPKGSVRVRIQPCANSVCGTIVWANARAQEKARRAGTPQLVGTQLFREFRQTGANRWSGRVFVPDMGRTFSGTLRSTGPNTIVARGCLVAGVFCKSQNWTRIG